MNECDCGYCGKCKKQREFEIEVERMSDNSYDRKRDDEPKEPEHYYWRI